MTDDTPSILSEALRWWNHGYAPLPVVPDGSKRPAVDSWKEHQHARPDAATVVQWFTGDVDGLGLICGAASGGLVMVEFEGRAVEEGFVEAAGVAMADHDAVALWERVTTGYVERTPSGGLHLYVRIPGADVPGNMRLARRPSTPAELEARPGQRTQVLIETRGQGGFTVIAPSGGRTHPTGAAWEVIAGSIDTLPVLTVDELDLLLAVLSTLDAMPARDVQPSSTAGQLRAASGTRPGDDFNARGSWDFLVAAGWQAARRFGQGRVGWVRPGKDPRGGISATTGGAADGIERLYVFTSASDFEPEEPYTRFAAWAHLEHAGDYAAAAKALAQLGYGTSPTPEEQLAGLIEPAGDPDRLTTPRSPMPTRHLQAVPDAPTDAAPVPQVDGTAALAVAPVSDLDLARYGATEDGLASALADRHGHELRHCPQRKMGWLAWDGARWEWDEAGRHREHIKALARQLPDNDTWRAHRKKMLSAAGVAGVAKMASTIADVVVHLDQLDVDPYALNTPGGMVDLRTGEVRATTPDDLCTRLTTVSVDRRRPTRWLAFLAETFDGDQSMIDYIQRLAGYSASGAQLEHVLPFLHGSGGNGKSVFLEVLVGILGDYASTAPPDFLLASARADEAAVARLSGLRLVACSEVNQSARFDEAKVKLLTGGDRLTARFLYGSHFTFVPTHHLWLMGNHQPRVEAGGESFWRRLRLLPFTRQVPKAQRVEGLAQQLIDAEGPQILGWIIDGAIEALSGKLREPEAVMAATASYAEEEDALGRFVADRVMLATGARTSTAEVRAAYAAWCRAEGTQELSPQMFGRELRSRWSIETVKSNGRRLYSGMTLYADADESDSEDPRDTDWSQR